MKNNEIQRWLMIEQPTLFDRLWRFYKESLRELNEASPLAQTLDKTMFRRWLKSKQAVKLFIEEQGEIVAFAIVSGNLRHDSLISIPYFRKHFPKRRIFHFPLIAIDPVFRKTNSGACEELMREMMSCIWEVPDAMALFFHSKGANPAMPRLIVYACRPNLKAIELDAMSCVALDRKFEA